MANALDAKRYVDEHPTEVKALFLDDPPAFMPAGFALRHSDIQGARFFTVALAYLKHTGILGQLAERDGVSAFMRSGAQ